MSYHVTRTTTRTTTAAAPSNRAFLDSADLQQLEFLAPAKLISSNQRLHHMARHRLTRDWRLATLQYARAGKLRKLHRAQITITIGFPTKHHRDINNYQPTAKAIIDGLVDYGLLPDDNDVYLIGPDLRRGEQVSTSVPRLTVDITPLCIDHHHTYPHRGCILR